MKWTDVKGSLELAAARLMARVGGLLLATTKHCRACSQKNRVVRGRRGAHCGKCGFPLGDVAL